MSEKFINRGFSIKENYPLRANISETRTTSLYEARHSSGRVLVQAGKFPILKNDAEESRVTENLHKSINVSQDLGLSILEYGIDNEGIIFCTMVWFDSKPLKPASFDRSVVLSLFIQCVQQVDEYHKNSIIIGDISLESFRLLSDGNIILLPPLGSYEKAGKKTIQLPRGVIADSMSPEQRIHGEISLISDIYSLGVVGAYLSSSEINEAVLNDNEAPLIKRVPAPSKMNSDLPEWFDRVLGSCLHVNPAKRTQNTNLLLSFVEDGIKKDEVNLPEVKWQSLDLIQRQKSQLTISSRNHPSSSAKSSNELQNTGKKSYGQKKKRPATKINKSRVNFYLFLIWGVTLGIGALIAFVLFVSFKVLGFSSDDLKGDLKSLYFELSDDNAKNHILVFADSSQDINLRVEAFSSLVGDSCSWDSKFLSEIAEMPISEKLHSEAKNLPAKYGKDFGYQKVLKLFGNYFDSISGTNKILQTISYVLVAIDPMELPESRINATRSLYKLDDVFAIKLVGLLSKESSPVIFLPVLENFIITKYYKFIPKDLSGNILFLLAPPLHDELEEESLDKAIASLNNKELIEYLRIILKNSSNELDPYLEQAVNIYQARNEMNMLSEYFIDIARSDSISDTKIKISFYKLALDISDISDLIVFNEWKDSRWEEVLYYTLVLSTNDKVLEKALDILSRRGVKNSTASMLIQWLKEGLWQKRSKYAYAVGVLALKDQFSEQEIEKAFMDLMPVSQHGLFSALVNIGEPFFIKEAINRLGPIVDPKEVTPLLTHELKEVRVGGVKALSGRNDLTTLQKILRAYRKEKDPEVRKLYNKLHWVTQEQEIPQSLRQKKLDPAN